MGRVANPYDRTKPASFMKTLMTKEVKAGLCYYRPYLRQSSKPNFALPQPRKLWQHRIVTQIECLTEWVSFKECIPRRHRYC